MAAENGGRGSDAIPEDGLATRVGAQVQREAARMAQDAFAQVFRLSVNEDEEGRARGVEGLGRGMLGWVAEAADESARSLRLAMLMAGLDQWGLAYSRAFRLQAIPALTELLGALRVGLDPREEARLEQDFAAVDAAEGNAIDFKIELRRAIHMALWHAMIACDEREEATAILVQLGRMLFGLTRHMPTLGWRLVADTLASIQINCLSDGLAGEGLAREMTESLFAALHQELPEEQRELAMGQASRTVLAWQQARRAPPGQVH